MATKLEQRVARLEKQMALLARQSQNAGNADWLSEILGKFEGDRDFHEIVRLGRQIRRADRPRNRRK